MFKRAENGFLFERNAIFGHREPRTQILKNAGKSVVVLTRGCRDNRSAGKPFHPSRH
jgi:hypothetical protein